ncbi:MAG: hypothetical protein J5582_06525 [Ruminococcus sp.]|uniref:hypothetical protein n=1 Tax=Ruminococcus sp. TaxID=41978 RepID=UPI002600D82D|nr:hypothetical protein [Ruminococcus sp.]MBO4866214.1 hypothetical protein [Ruminococcus sp.]
MVENRKLTELLGRDRESRAFFASLSPELRRLLMARDIGNFQALKKAVSECGGETFAAEDMTEGQTASGTESTGIFPRGEDISAEKWRELGGR